MLPFLSSLKLIGLEWASSSIKFAEVIEDKGAPRLVNVGSIPTDSPHSVKRLYINHPLLITGIDGLHVLLRHMHLPLTKEKDIEEALAFQAEPLLPYTADQALLARQTIKKGGEGTDLLLLATRKDYLQAHLDKWKVFGIEPEIVSCTQAALCQFGNTYLSSEQAYLILHFDEQSATCLLIKEGKMTASFSQREDLQIFSQKEVRDSELFADHSDPVVQEALGRLKQTSAKMVYSLTKEVAPHTLAGMVVTGEALKWLGLDRFLAASLNLSLLPVQDGRDSFSAEIKLQFALPIGLALCGLPKAAPSIDFRQQELAYPHPWKRLKQPIALYFALMIGLSVAFYGFSNSYLRYRENQLKQEYVDLLGGLSKSYNQFETAFLAKTPSAREKFQGEVVDIAQLDQEDLMERLAFLQKDLQAMPDSFPLFANIPRVSDVLAWLSQHPAASYRDEKGELQSRLQIENFNYTILKRPMQGKKQEKYQVKVELEFSSPLPKWAREFHDALIAPNDWVDPKGEVKWSSNRGRYKTSFFLKDKTVYPGQ